MQFKIINSVRDRAIGWHQKIHLTKIQYKFYLNRDLTLKRLLTPHRFSEKMQWRKLFDSSKIFTTFSDRVAVRSFIRDRGFGEMLVEQLWIGTDPNSIPFDSLPCPFVLKSSHASGQVLIIRTNNDDLNRKKIIGTAASWLDVCYGTRLGERGYIGVPRRLIVEPLLSCDDGRPPVELKIFVFEGVAEIFQYNDIDEDRNYKIGYLDRHWELFQWNTTLIAKPVKPDNLDLAVRAAESLCAGIDHCRVDFYIVDKELYIGEMTPYSWSGMVVLNPPHTDIIMGSFWKLRLSVVRALWVMATSDWGAN